MQNSKVIIIPKVLIKNKDTNSINAEKNQTDFISKLGDTKMAVTNQKAKKVTQKNTAKQHQIL